MLTIILNILNQSSQKENDQKFDHIQDQQNKTLKASPHKGDTPPRINSKHLPFETQHDAKVCPLAPHVNEEQLYNIKYFYYKLIDSLIYCLF